MTTRSGGENAPDAKPAKRYLDTKAAAEYLSATPKQLESWRSKGCGPTYVKRSARFLRYDVVDLDAWMAERRVHNTAQVPEEVES